MRELRFIGMTAFLFACFVCFLLSAGCHGTRVIIEDQPTYREPPPGPPPWAPAHGHRAKHRYRYYRSSHVYYDVGRKVYFHYIGGHWRVAVSLPAGIHIDVHDYVTLDMETSRPYEYHSEVIERYPPGRMKKKHNKKGKKW